VRPAHQEIRGLHPALDVRLLGQNTNVSRRPVSGPRRSMRILRLERHTWASVRGLMW
jgi:hypothetical protein